MVLHAEIDLERVVIGGRRHLGILNTRKTQIRADPVGVECAGQHVGAASIREERRVEWPFEALVRILIPHILHGDDGARHQLVLDAQAPLVAGRDPIILGQRVDAAGENRHRGLLPVHHADTRVGEVNVSDTRVKRERRIWPGVVDVVALNPFEERAKTSAYHGSSLTGYIVCETDAGTERVPVVVHEASRNAILTRQPDAVQIKRDIRQRHARHRLESRPRTIETPIRVEARRL